MAADKVFNLNTAAQNLGITRRSLRTLIRNGQGPDHFRVGREFRITKEALDRFSGRIPREAA